MTPYVYKITHKPTGKYYIGSKYAGWYNNKKVTELIGEDYYTNSSDKFIQETFTKERVADWDIYIIYRTRGDEHDPIAEAVTHENLFIGMHINDELCLNKHYQDIYTNKAVWMAETGRVWSEEMIARRTATRKKNNNGKPSPCKGRKQSPEVIENRAAKLREKKYKKSTRERERIKKGIKKRPPEVEAALHRKRLATNAAKSPEEKARINAKISATVKATNAAKSPEQKARDLQNRKDGHARRTPEAEANRVAKIQVTRKRNRALKQHAFIIENLHLYIEATK